MDALEDILGENYVHPNINARYSRLKIRERIKQSQGLWKVLKVSANRVGKGLHKVFKDGVD